MIQNLDEVARYLGYRGQGLEPVLEDYARLCLRELEASVQPRFVSRKLEKEQLEHHSRDLAHHLRNCRQVILYAVTLGTETDRLMRRWSAVSMAKAAVGQACAAAWMDELCDDFCTEKRKELDKGQFLTPSFSPGYGDWKLEEQSRVLNLLQAHKRIGLTLTAGGMLVPEKSVTAVVGISTVHEDACGQKCLRCGKTDCAFRKGSPL